MKTVYTFFICCFTLYAYTQSSDSTQVIVLQDGSTYVGIIKNEDSDKITLDHNAIGLLTISKTDVDTVYWSNYAELGRDTELLSATDYWFDPPIRSINYLTETALPLEEGEMYYQNIVLFGQKIGYGVTDHFTINGGIEFYTVLYERGPPSLLIAPKYTFTNSDNPVQFAIGTNILLPNNNGGYDFGGTTYGILTFGNSNHNLSVGAGIVFAEEGIYDYPIFQVSAQTRLSRSLGLVFDSLTGNFEYDEFVNVSSLMLRFLSPKLIFDLGGVFSLDESVIIPMANFAIRI